jgi:protocatechuate 4,5-dioxygenase alpha chain
MRTRLYSLDELDDIPGTKVFNAMRSRQAYHLHKFCMSLMDPANREAFRRDESAYLDRFRMSPEQKHAVISRDFNQLIELGGNIYFLVKLSNTDGWSTQKAVGSMTGMTPDEYAAMMRAGGRPIEGNRSIKDGN